VRYNESTAAKTPMETRAKGRIYVTVTTDGGLKAITSYDKVGKRYKQIDISGRPHTINGKRILPHTHVGYEHDEHGTNNPSEKERKLVDKVLSIWNNKNSKK